LLYNIYGGGFHMARRTRLFVVLAVTGAILVGILASLAVAQSGNRNFSAERMRGVFEIPAVSTTARGSFEATLNNDTDTVSYRLEFSGLQTVSGTPPSTPAVTQAHIHFAQSFANGGITVWLCETAAVPAPAAVAAATPDCGGPTSGTITDSFNAAEVLATGNPAGSQGISAGEFDEFIAAMRDGLTYANVHSTGSPGGEIRAQIRRGGGGGNDDDDRGGDD
jgi:hypothetical protein